MEAHAAEFDRPVSYPVAVDVRPQTEQRNRLTTFFRFFLGLPHLILVGGPVALITSVGWGTHDTIHLGYGSTGIIGFFICLVAIAAWFVIVVTARHPEKLWQLAHWYLGWRVRAISYMTLLRDDYPPFGEGEYPVQLQVDMPVGERDRVNVALRLILAIPHIVVLWFLSLAWGIATAIAWVLILITGRYPETLYGFAIGVLAWSVRVEAYMLLLRDEYPPFTLRA
jgi:hypothetical protein